MTSYRMTVGLCVVLAVFTLPCFSVSATASPTYTITEVDFGITTVGFVTGVNNTAQVVGYARDSDGTYRLCLWENGSVTEIASSDSESSLGINNLGEVVGEHDGHAFRWTREGGMVDINPGGMDSSRALRINDMGDIVGYSWSDDFFWRGATLWQDNQTMAYGGSGWTYFTDINNAGVIAGFNSDVYGTCWPHMYTNPSWISFPDASRGGYWEWDILDLSGVGRANSINDSAQVVGWMSEPYSGAVMWSEGQVIELGTGEATGINNSCQVVGPSSSYWWAQDGYAFLWENGVRYDLNDLVVGGGNWILHYAADISDTGYIIGQGLFSGQTALFLLSPAQDNCPNDPEKISPGICGCGVADTDSDSDGVADCVDYCPNTVPAATVDADGCPPIIPGDFDRDGDVEADDLEQFESCATGPAIPQINTACAKARLDSDDDVDQSDFGLLQRCISGEDVPADASCMN